VGEPRQKRATYQDVLDAPPNKVAEVVNGELHLSPRPAVPHALVASAINVEIGGPFGHARGGPGGWIILLEPELHLEEDIVVPDLGGWRRERMPTGSRDAYLILAPDWACEILSRSTRRLDRSGKLPIYGREGVGHVWLIEPLAQTVEVLRLEGTTYRIVAVHAGDTKARIEPFDAIELDLTILWRDIPPENL
jgi:Uma2 family endonuclease